MKFEIVTTGHEASQALVHEQTKIQARAIEIEKVKQVCNATM